MNLEKFPVRRAMLALVVPVFCAIGITGCQGKGPVSQAEGPVVSRGVTSPGGKAAIHRYTVDRFDALRNTKRAPFVVPTKSMAVVLRSSSKRNAEKAEGAAPVSRKENGKLFLAETDTTPKVTAMLGIRAEDYNELRIRMRVSRGSQCVITWTTDIEPSSMRSQGISIPIFADNQVHEYRQSMGSLETETWIGRVRSIVLTPSETPAEIEIESIELGYLPPDSPTRVTIAAETHEAAFGTQPPWELTIPQNASFSASIGMPAETWEDERDGSARFIATMDTEKEKGVLLIDQPLTPKTNEEHRDWIPFKASLAEYAGQKARITFKLDSVDGKKIAPGCWGDPMVYGGEKENPVTPVVLISCDTLAANHLSCYGYARETTPNLDAFAKEGVVFENAISPETWTLPSHASMFTGQYPKHHGVTPNANLAESTVTLPEAMSSGGYLCGGYIGFTFWLYPWRGFAHGFDVYNTPSWRFRSIFDTHKLAGGWLDAVDAKNVFLFLHNFDVHSKPAKQYDGLPYGPDNAEYLHFAKEITSPPTFARPGRDIVDAEAFLTAVNHGEITITEEERAYCMALYDDCVRMIDSALHDVFEKLKQKGLYDDALIIVTADHGEEFGEHGTMGHGNVFEQALHIPMVIKFPHGEFAGTRYKPMVELVDVMPTILDVAGVSAPEGLDGHSLRRALNGTDKPREQGYSQRFLQRTVREVDWKLILTSPGVFELYNLADDPQEKNNVAAAHPDQVERMRPLLEKFFAVNPQGWHVAFKMPNLDWKGTLTISAEDNIESAVLLGGQDVASLNKSERGVTLNLGKISRATSDELVVRTVGTAGRISLNVHAPEEFTLTLGDQPEAYGKQFANIVLDPEKMGYPKPAVKPGPAEKAEFRVWYVPQTGTRSAAQQLSPDAINELKSLGYTGGE